MRAHASTHDAGSARSVPQRSAPARKLPITGVPETVTIFRCACGGSCPRCQEDDEQPGIQPQLAVSRPGDRWEREADRVADQVLRGDRVGPLGTVSKHPQRKCEERPAAAVAQGGARLSAAEREYFEARFGRDFSDVRVHDDLRAHSAAETIHARAFTLGTHIAFGRSEYRPGTPSGRRLLAHELAHVVQQRHGQGQQVQRAVREENVSCRNTGLRNPNLTGPEAVAAIRAADAEAITLARRAELLIDFHLLFTRAGDPVDAAFDTILQEELGLTLTNPAHFPLIEQQRDRFQKVRETLESGYLRYMCRGGTVSLVGCTPGSCTGAFAFTCPGNRLVVLCQPFWDQPDERPGTILHEPFHIWYHMARHATNALRRADASCFEAFARRLAGEAPPASCAGHTNG